MMHCNRIEKKRKSEFCTRAAEWWYFQSKWYEVVFRDSLVMSKIWSNVKRLVVRILKISNFKSIPLLCWRCAIANVVSCLSERQRSAYKLEMNVFRETNVISFESESMKISPFCLDVTFINFNVYIHDGFITLFNSKKIVKFTSSKRSLFYIKHSWEKIFIIYNISAYT